MIKQYGSERVLSQWIFIGFKALLENKRMHILFLKVVRTCVINHSYIIYYFNQYHQNTIYPSINLSIHISIYLSIYSLIHLSIYPAIHVFIYQSTLSFIFANNLNLSVCLFICISLSYMHKCISKYFYL